VKRAFVIGHPVAHSRSPLIHGYWLQKHGIDGSYEAIDVAPAALGKFIEDMPGTFLGGNVTIPLKEAVYALCDSLDPLAEEIGAVNTLIVSNGGIHGLNTDYLGFLGNLDQQVPGWSDGLSETIVLGAGGASRAVLVALKSRGIGCIHLLNRSEGKAEDLAIEIGGPVRAGTLGQFAARAPNAGLVVNTTSLGMHGTPFEGLDLMALPSSALVTDLVYTPLLTPLLADAARLKLRTVDGLGMLLHQAVPGFEAWFGVRPKVTPELRALIEATLQ
jgi:shikimate dehydrogenase